MSGDQQDTIVSDDQESAIPNHGELHVKADAAREYIQDNLGGSCTELSPVEDADANGDETSTCSTDYGSIIIMSSSSIDDTHYYLMNTMGANLDAWEEQGVFFIAAPDVLELIQ